MPLFRRKRGDDPSGPVPPPGLLALLDQVRRPCVAIAPADRPPTAAASSYTGGHPYSPDDEPWPEWGGEPMFFLAQLDFRELNGDGYLAGFPSSGLLQWFVGADPTQGLTFDDGQGRAGFHLRWHADPSRPSLRRPSDRTPWHEAEASGAEVYAPLEDTSAVAVAARKAVSLPSYGELPDGWDPTPLIEWASQVGEPPSELEFVWDEHVRGPSSRLVADRAGSNLGGFASFTQFDPRGAHGYPAAASPAGRLLVELDSEQYGGWGDGGIGHLFGDAAAVAAGDLSSVTYHWDCM